MINLLLLSLSALASAPVEYGQRFTYHSDFYGKGDCVVTSYNSWYELTKVSAVCRFDLVCLTIEGINLKSIKIDKARFKTRPDHHCDEG